MLWCVCACSVATGGKGHGRREGTGPVAACLSRVADSGGGASGRWAAADIARNSGWEKNGSCGSKVSICRNHSSAAALASMNSSPRSKVLACGIDALDPPSRRRDCYFVDVPSPSLLKRLLQEEGGAAEQQSRRRLDPPASNRLIPSCRFFGALPSTQGDVSAVRNNTSQCTVHICYTLCGALTLVRALRPHPQPFDPVAVSELPDSALPPVALLPSDELMRPVPLVVGRPAVLPVVVVVGHLQPSAKLSFC